MLNCHQIIYKKWPIKVNIARIPDKRFEKFDEISIADTLRLRSVKVSWSGYCFGESYGGGKIFFMLQFLLKIFKNAGKCKENTAFWIWRWKCERQIELNLAESVWLHSAALRVIPCGFLVDGLPHAPSLMKSIEKQWHCVLTTAICIVFAKEFEFPMVGSWFWWNILNFAQNWTFFVSQIWWFFFNQQ